jgi:hypothetical protein
MPASGSRSCGLVDSLPLLNDLAPGVKYQRIDFPVTETWGRFNPSIVRADGGFLCTVRSSNAHIENGRYVFPTGGFPFLTENYLARFDDDLRMLSVDKLRDETRPQPTYRSRFPGYTDLRLFPGPYGWQATAAVNERNPQDLNQQVLVQIRDGAILDPLALSSPEAGHQKNWMPVLGAALPTLVTHCAPTTVMRFDLAREFSETIAEHPGPSIARDFRGGSQLVPVTDGNICLIHETVRGGKPRRLYLHRVVHFTSDFRIDAVSPRFVFQVREVEFCAGLARHDGRFVLSFGVSDYEAWLATIPERQLLSLLVPVGSAT